MVQGFCLLGLTVLAGAEPVGVDGAAWTLDGQEYRGQLQLGPQVLRVVPGEGQPVEIPFRRLDRAVFGLGPDSAQFGPLRGGWTAQDVGEVDVTGWAGQAGSAFVLRAVGTGGDDKTEAFHLVHHQARGNAELTARLVRIDGPDRQTRASLTLRESLAPGSPLALVGLNAGGRLCFQSRTHWGQKARTLALAPVPLPQWLRLVKQASQCTAYHSADGRQWTLAGTTNLAMGERFCIGLALSAHGAFQVAQAQFDQVHLVVSGLRGEYFADPDFGTTAWVRVEAPLQFAWAHRPPAESVPADRFSVRWTGQIEAEDTGDYTFHLDTDGVARLWVNGQLVAAQQPGRTGSAGPAPKPRALPLQAGHRYELRLEYQKGGGPGTLCLAWTTPRRQRQVVPADRLYCVPELPILPTAATAAAVGSVPGTAKGVWLCTGSFLAGQVRAVDEREIKLAFQGARELTVPMAKAARVVLRVVARAAPAEPIQRGVLLSNGDFIQGDFRRIEGRQIQLSSVLFGLRKLQLDSVAALYLRPLAPSPAAFEVRTTEGSVLRAEALRGESGALQVQEAGLGMLRLSMATLAEIRRTQP